MSCNVAKAVSAPQVAPNRKRARGFVRLARLPKIVQDRNPLQRFIASETGTVYHGLHRFDFSPKPPTGQGDQQGTSPSLTAIMSRNFARDFARAGDIDPEKDRNLAVLQQVARQWFQAGCPEAGDFVPDYDQINVDGEES